MRGLCKGGAFFFERLQIGQPGEERVPVERGARRVLGYGDNAIPVAGPDGIAMDVEGVAAPLDPGAKMSSLLVPGPVPASTT